MQIFIKKYLLKVVRVSNTIAVLFSKRGKKSKFFNPLPNEIVSAYNKSRTYGPRKKICYAPYKSMYFGFDGMVSACCINRNKIMGIFPKMDIKKIWNSTEYKTLRDYISNNDLSYGCDLCRKLLFTKNFSGAVSNFFDRYTVKPYPRIMEFELDNTCNLACIFCNEKASSTIAKKRENIIYNSNFIKQLSPFIPYLKAAKFYGGEPFLIPIYYEIWEKMMEINKEITFLIQTNGTILNEKVRSVLSKGKFNINISIDSTNKSNFERIRKNAQFEQVMDNVQFFKNYCDQKGTYLCIIATPNITNWEEIPELTNWASSLNAIIHFNTLIHPPELSLWALPKNMMEHIYNNLKNAPINDNSKVAKDNKIHYIYLLKQINEYIIHDYASINYKTKITQQAIEDNKREVFEKLGQYFDSHKELDKIALTNYFKKTLSFISPTKTKDLIYIKLNQMPVERVANELIKGELNYLVKLAEKKTIEGNNEFEIID